MYVGVRQPVIENASEESAAGKLDQNLPSLESIKLEPVDSEDMSTSKSRRRRSLLDMTQSPKPTLIMKGQQNSQESRQGTQSAGGAAGNSQVKGSIIFKMPTGSQLSNLCKIQVGVLAFVRLFFPCQWQMGLVNDTCSSV